MKHVLLLLLLALTVNVRAQISHEFNDTLLIDALQTISQEQMEYAIIIQTDDIDQLRTTTSFKDLSVPDAVKKVCKGLPVKVKTRDRQIFVQAKKEKEKDATEVLLKGNLQDAFLERGLFNVKLTLLRADSTEVESKAQVYEIGNDSMHVTTLYWNERGCRRKRGLANLPWSVR